jgi:hypothetical protein
MRTRRAAPKFSHSQGPRRGPFSALGAWRKATGLGALKRHVRGRSLRQAGLAGPIPLQLLHLVAMLTPSCVSMAGCRAQSLHNQQQLQEDS